MDQYNDVSSQLDTKYIATSLQDVLLSNSIFWTATTSSESNMRDVEYNIKKDIIQAFLFSERSREEVEMLKKDMLSLVTYWAEQIRIVSQTPNTDMYSRGARVCWRSLSGMLN